MARGRGGFAMVVVVFMLFAITLSGAAGYQLVFLEAELARQDQESETALAVATAGLARYLGHGLGTPDDSVTFAVSGGHALLRSRKVAVVDSVTDLYLITSVGTVEDARWGGAPALRSVSQYARLRKDPVNLRAALMASANQVRVVNSLVGSEVDGRDSASGGCPTAGLHDQIGIINTGSVTVAGASLLAGDSAHAQLAGHAALLDTAALRWDVLQSPDFNIPGDGNPPGWSGATGVFRATENLTAGWSWSGSGVLIVPGTFTPSFLFNWDGIILAGRLGNLTPPLGLASIRGIVVGGLDGSQNSVDVGMSLLYHSCHAMEANALIAYLEPVDQTWWEEF